MHVGKIFLLGVDTYYSGTADLLCPASVPKHHFPPLPVKFPKG